MRHPFPHRVTPLLAALLMGIASVALPAKLPQTAQAVTGFPATRTTGSSIAAEVLREVNTFRAQNHLPPLGNSIPLQQAAQRHSDNMAANRNISHNCADGTTFSQRITQSGYLWHSIAENVAAGQASATEVVQAWIHSPGHRANLLKSDIKDAGIGFNNRYWTLDLAG